MNPSVRRRRRRRRIFVVICLLILVLGGGYLWLQRGDEVAEDQPLVVTVETGNIENTIASAGSLQPSRVVDVGAQVSGQLQKLHVEVGDLVEQGQLLAEIDARVQESRVEASRASIEALEAQVAARRASLELARANAARQERLMAEDATSQLDYDNAVNTLAAAESSLIQLEKQIQQSRASLASDETELEYTKIYAPAAGTVVSIEMNEGRTLNAVQQAPTILRIADLSTMTVETEISEADIGKIKKGMSVYFTTLGGGNRRWYSSVRQVLPTPVIENNVVLYTGLFDIGNRDGTLLPEMTAQVFFVTAAAQDVLTVPLGALTFADDMTAGFTARTADGGGFPGGERTVGFPDPNSPEGKALRERFQARMAEGGGMPGGLTPRAGGLPGGIAPPVPGGNGSTTGNRHATVRLVRDDGTIEERPVVIGVTSRIKAEVISGLSAGDKVVAGIVQSGSSGNATNEFRPPRGGFAVFAH